jgi:hypothetical protein
VVLQTPSSKISYAPTVKAIYLLEGRRASLRLVMGVVLRLMQRNLCLGNSMHQEKKKKAFEGQRNAEVCDVTRGSTATG